MSSQERVPRPRLVALMAAAAAAITLILGVGFYAIRVIWAMSRSVRRSASGDNTADGLLKWADAGLFVLAVVAIFLTVRSSLMRLSRNRLSAVSVCLLSAGAVSGTILGAFANHTLQLSSAPHLFLRTPEHTRGVFWLVPLTGWVFGVIGGGIATASRSWRGGSS